MNASRISCTSPRALSMTGSDLLLTGSRDGGLRNLRRQPRFGSSLGKHGMPCV